MFNRASSMFLTEFSQVQVVRQILQITTGLPISNGIPSHRLSDKKS